MNWQTISDIPDSIRSNETTVFLWIRPSSRIANPRYVGYAVTAFWCNDSKCWIEAYGGEVAIDEDLISHFAEIDNPDVETT